MLRRPDNWYRMSFEEQLDYCSKQLEADRQAREDCEQLDCNDGWNYGLEIMTSAYGWLHALSEERNGR